MGISADCGMCLSKARELLASEKLVRVMIGPRYERRRLGKRLVLSLLLLVGLTEFFEGGRHCRRSTSQRG